jgi:hypothetical protein
MTELEHSDSIDPDLTARINEQEELGGIDIRKLASGTKIIAKTLNSTYTIEILNPDKRKVRIQGGGFFEQPEEVFLIGSSWGQSSVKLGWIGYTMKMEIYREGHLNPLVTTDVQSAKVIGSNWEYELWV